MGNSETDILGSKSIVLTCLVYRIANSLLLQTWFEPDEYWQCLEPAHRLAFGYGYLTWEWRHGLRSYLYPVFIASIYKICHLLHVDYASIIVFAPKLCQCLLGVVADVFYFSLVELFFSQYVAVLTMATYWLNWFQFFCTPRTLANTVETQLLIIGLYYFPWPARIAANHAAVGWRPSTHTYLTIAALSSIMRPTAALFWLPLITWHFWKSSHKFKLIFDAMVIVAFPVLTFVLLLDRICYGRWVFSLWTFFKFNFLTDGSAHFGVHPWHWYFMNGLPTILFTHLIPIVLGVYKSNVRWIALICLWYIGIHSLIPHKELRFLLPVVPLLNIYAGLYLESDSYLSMGLKNCQNFHLYWLCASKRVKALIGLLFVTNVPFILYTGLFHQRGVLDVTAHLHNLALDGRIGSVWFLTPCHTTPLYSHIHAEIPVRFLTCEPNFNNTSGYVDEADRFYKNPTKWLNDEFNVLTAENRPSHVVIFEKLWNSSKAPFKKYGYGRCAKFFNTHFPVSGRQSQYLLVLCKKYSSPDVALPH